MTSWGHIALIDRSFADDLIAGRKTVESRFMKTRRAPFGAVQAGDLIVFKISGGQVIGTWRATWVREFVGLSPAEMQTISRRYNSRILAPRCYWLAKRNARFGVLIGLAYCGFPVNEIRYRRQFGNAWITSRPLQTKLPRVAVPTKRKRAG